MIVHDTGALVAGERDDRHVWALHDAALRRGITPTVPAGVLAQAWRGGAQARLPQLLRGCVSAPWTSRWLGTWDRCAPKAETSDVVDASVVLIAIPNVAIVTSDEPDIRYLASSAGASLTVHEM